MGRPIDCYLRLKSETGVMGKRTEVERRKS
jgi:hypothetical protein